MSPENIFGTTTKKSLLSSGTTDTELQGMERNNCTILDLIHQIITIVVAKIES